MKKCTNCESHYPLDREHFQFIRRYESGAEAWDHLCKPCRNAANRDYRAHRRGHFRTYQNNRNARLRGDRAKRNQDPELMSFHQIAPELGISHQAVQAIYKKAIAKLRRKFPNLRDQVILTNERDPDAPVLYAKIPAVHGRGGLPISQMRLLPNPLKDQPAFYRLLDKRRKGA